MPIEDVLVLDVDDGRVTVAGSSPPPTALLIVAAYLCSAAAVQPPVHGQRVTATAGEAVTLQHALLQPLPGQVSSLPNTTLSRDM